MISGIADYSRNYSCQLTLIGQGPLKDSLKQYSESLSISDSIIWKDEIEHVVPFLAGFDLFVLSSKYEGFGMVLLESMLAKLPIIAAANEAVREVLGDNFPGLFEVGSATSLSKKLEEFSSPIARNSLLTKQEEILKKYDSVYMANSIEKVYLS
jgi:glycosyltransferase involved in cell wall biosynthesis